jgi:hypothetical protein
VGGAAPWRPRSALVAAARRVGAGALPSFTVVPAPPPPPTHTPHPQPHTPSTHPHPKGPSKYDLVANVVHEGRAGQQTAPAAYKVHIQRAVESQVRRFFGGGGGARARGGAGGGRRGRAGRP